MPGHSDDISDSYEQERLHDAARSGDPEECRRLLDEGHQPHAFDDLGKTPLHYAAEVQHLEVMKLLIDSGASVNAHDERVIGNTPLGEVAGNCSFAVAKLLIDSGADPTIPGWMQLAAVHKAQERKRPEGLRVRHLLEQAARKFDRT
ncbi:MAG: ankyrin repeat domain-containing protein [Pyrinomonadaceae bacterium]|nr:ankyrin repeat domain-containing protein [Pyrinomonadaceae bacterium]